MAVKLNCERCEIDFTVSPSKAAGRRFCSRACSAAHMVGPAASRWNGGPETLACSHCGNEVQDWRSQRRGRAYCGRECYAAALRGSEPHNKGDVVWANKPCAECGGEITGRAWEVRKRKYCSEGCSHESQRTDTPAHRKFDTEYRQWRKSVLERDGWHCVWCRSRGEQDGGRLEVHHLIPVVAVPELVLNAANAVTLCAAHHLRTRQYESRFAEMLASMAGLELLAEPVDARRRAA